MDYSVAWFRLAPLRIYAGDLCRHDLTVSNTLKRPRHRVWTRVDSADPQWKGARIFCGKIDRDEQNPGSHEAMILIAMIGLMVRRLAR